MERFKTHTGEVVAGNRLDKAIADVKADYIAMAHNLFASNDYPKHITQEDKERFLVRNLERAENIELHNFTIWQRVNEKLTGECVGFLSI